MLTQSDQIHMERSRQTIARVGFVCITVAVVLLIDKLLQPFHLYFFAMVGSMAFYQWSNMDRSFEHRLVMVTFKTQIHPIFVYQRTPGDNEVMTRRKYATDMLSESGNNHRVKVYTYIFGDVLVFVDTVSPDGSVTTERHFVKDATPATQTWFDYQNFCIQYEIEKTNDFVGIKRSDPAGDEWFNVHHFKQST